MKRIAIRTIVLSICLWLGVVVFNLFSNPATKLGVVDGRLPGCPDSPNCVSTQTEKTDYKIEPIAFAGTEDEAISKVKTILSKMTRMRVVSETENYLHATATTALMRYVDDVEFFYDVRAGLLHFRSASRVGYSDLGANRARMEAFRKLFDE